MEEFDILKYVFDTLKALDIPVYFVSKKEVSPPMVVFNITGERGNVFWENDEQETVYKITVNIFSRTNFIKYKNQIMKLMKGAGFLKYDVPSCIYLEDVDMFNQPLQFRFYREINYGK